MNKLKKRIYLVLKIGVMVAMIATIAPIHALEDGAYLVTRTTSYADPRTGKIADGGSSSNQALGDSMANGVIEKQLLVEQINGATYVTLGVGLMSNIRNVRIQANDQPAAFTKTGSSTRDGDRVDHYRFRVPSLATIISPTLYVTPMGRDVTFFIQLHPASITAGTGVYNAMLVGQTKKEEPKKEAKAPTTPNKTTDKQAKAEDLKKKEVQPVQEKTEETGEGKQKVAFRDPLQGVKGLTKYMVTSKAPTSTTQPIVIAGSSLLVVALALVGYVVYKKKRGIGNEETM